LLGRFSLAIFEIAGETLPEIGKKRVQVKEAATYKRLLRRRFGGGIMKAPIPTLQAVLDPRELGRHLGRVLPAQWGRVQDIRISVFQRHGGRCTVDISLQTTTGKRELIGKVYSEDRSDVYRAMKQISQSGFGPEAEFSIPQPLAFIPELQLVLQEKVEGPLATEVFLNGTESERARAAERCARWLAHFHAQASLSAPVFLLRHELMEYWVSRLAERAGPQAEKLMEKATLLFKRLEIAAANHDGVEMRPCHGSYCHYQIIFTETRTVTLDWDRFCVTHPSHDVARFIIILQQLALDSQGSLRALDGASEVFYKTYTGISRFEVAKHLPVYKAAHCLKHARDYLKRGEVKPEMSEIMLDEGLSILTKECTFKN
jgi:aminoglycoside phosphotransferase (APT) family kinase protein